MFHWVLTVRTCELPFSLCRHTDEPSGAILAAYNSFSLSAIVIMISLLATYYIFLVSKYEVFESNLPCFGNCHCSK